MFSRLIAIKYKLDSEGKQETRVGLNVSYKPDIKESAWGSQEEDKVLKVESGLHHKVPAQGLGVGIASINDFNVFYKNWTSKDFHKHRSYIQNIKYTHFLNLLSMLVGIFQME